MASGRILGARAPVPEGLFAPYAQDEEAELSDKSKGIIHRVVEVYGQYSGTVLSAATHKEKTPWSNIAEKTPGGIIPDSEIKRYYETLIKV